MKKVDITEKLDLGGNPYLVIAGDELEVNADAATMLKVLGIIAGEPMSEAQRTLKLYDLIFPAKSQELIGVKRLNFQDLKVVIQEAMDLISGNEDEEGEDQPHATT